MYRARQRGAARGLRAHDLLGTPACLFGVHAAGVKKLVLSHFIPADDPAVSDQGARTHFSKEVILGKDLFEL